MAEDTSTEDLDNPGGELIAGVGRIGDTTTDYYGTEKRTFHAWQKMIRRCYDESYKNYDFIGAEGCTVCERWKTFSNFEEDRRELEGSQKYWPGVGVALLPGETVYSPDTVRWGTPRMRQHTDFIATSPGGEEFLEYDRTHFAVEHDLNKSGISACLQGLQNNHRGWTFRYADE